MIGKLPSNEKLNRTDRGEVLSAGIALEENGILLTRSFLRCREALTRQRALRCIARGIIVWASANKLLPPPNG
jgi:hypothetical protein